MTNQASEGKWDREFPHNLGIAADGHKRKVLVVDDEHSITDILAIIFNQYGFDASVAYDGEDAVESAQRISPEFVIMGVIMPRMNGIEAAISIRNCLPSCKILLYSASVIRSKAAKGDHRKTGQRGWPGTELFYWLGRGLAPYSVGSA
jgi:CheY-like chemotaxis protein